MAECVKSSDSLLQFLEDIQEFLGRIGEIPGRDHRVIKDPGLGAVSKTVCDAGGGGTRCAGNQGKDKKSEPWELRRRYG